MTTFGLVLIGTLMIVGLFGVLVPVIPGLLLVAGAATWWAIGDGGTTTHIVILSLILALGIVGTVLKYVVPAKKTAGSGVSTGEMVFAAACGVCGMFILPVIGAPIGFVAGIFAAKRARGDDKGSAWESTMAAVRAIGWSLLIEFCAGALMFFTWIVGVLLTR